MIFLTKPHDQVARVDAVLTRVALDFSREGGVKTGEPAGDGHRVHAAFAQQRLNEPLADVHGGFEIDVRHGPAPLQNRNQHFCDGVSGRASHALQRRINQHRAFFNRAQRVGHGQRKIVVPVIAEQGWALLFRRLQVSRDRIGIHAASGIDEACNVCAPLVHLGHDRAKLLRRNRIGLHCVIRNDET